MWKIDTKNIIIKYNINNKNSYILQKIDIKNISIY